MKRRSFGQLGISTCAALAIGTAQPGGWLQTLAGELATQDQSSSVTDRILVVIQLSGGNDGLNTIVPYRDELYAKARPKLGIPSNDVIKLTEELGLHPSLRAIENQFSENRFSIIQGVGYPSPNRSHFESMDIWHSCHPKKDRSQSGWLGRWITEQTAHPTSDSTAIHIGSDTLPLACQERGVQVPSLASLEQMRLKAKLDSMQDKQSRPGAEPNSKDSGSLLDFLSTSTVSALEVSERLDKILAQPDASGDFPKTALGEKLRAVSRLILSGLKTRIYYVTLDGFDTHANQPDVHASLLKQWSEALAAFLSRLKQTGQQDRVLVMTFSEFGRRVSENASLGTDHGAAAPMFLAGPKLPKIIHGPMPDLSDLEDGDLRFKIDFRSVYASVLEHWMMTDSRKALDGDYHDQVEQLRLFS
ncbi:MAG: DUF1501 domain-containing protein [Planctomycetota bacterium]|jgi:uncharacterized protein (DUF1501 family)